MKKMILLVGLIALVLVSGCIQTTDKTNSEKSPFQPLDDQKQECIAKVNHLKS